MYFLNLCKPIYFAYQDYLNKSKVIDFNDMINKAEKICERRKIWQKNMLISLSMNFKIFLLADIN